MPAIHPSGNPALANVYPTDYMTRMALLPKRSGWIPPAERIKLTKIKAISQPQHLAAKTVTKLNNTQM